LDGGHLYDVPVDEIIQGLMLKNGIKGTYSDPVNNTDNDKRHVVFFNADPELKSNLEKCQKGSHTFFLNLWGQDRELQMARNPLVVAAEEAAVMRSRVETALAKAIAASERLALIPAEPAVATPDHPEQQGKKETDYVGLARNSEDSSNLIGPVAPKVNEFMRKYQQVQREHKEQQQQQQQQDQLQQQQQEHRQPGILEQPGAGGPDPLQRQPQPEAIALEPPATRETALEVWELSQQPVITAQEPQSVLGSWELKQRQLSWELKMRQQQQVQLFQQQQRQLQGKRDIGNHSKLNHKSVTYSTTGTASKTKDPIPPRTPSVDSRITVLNTSGGAPRETWATVPKETRDLEASPSPPSGRQASPTKTPPEPHNSSATSDANTTTGSSKVDQVRINLAEEDMNEDIIQEMDKFLHDEGMLEVVLVVEDEATALLYSPKEEEEDGGDMAVDDA
jgi:hypothetical protein